MSCTIQNMTDTSKKNWQTPEFLLMLMAIAVPVSFATWQALLNNFSIEQASFTGKEIGILQSLREIPGFFSLQCCFYIVIH